uniref:Uncharacterized protein n=1 Tax=Clastoptera arizonana TaxID=38151 RepID=A0A1B6CRQ0_9HEMI
MFRLYIFLFIVQFHISFTYDLLMMKYINKSFKKAFLKTDEALQILFTPKVTLDEKCTQYEKLIDAYWKPLDYLRKSWEVLFMRKDDKDYLYLLDVMKSMKEVAIGNRTMSKMHNMIDVLDKVKIVKKAFVAKKIGVKEYEDRVYPRE